MHAPSELLLLFRHTLLSEILQRLYFVERMTTYRTLKPMQQCRLELGVKTTVMTSL